MILQSLRLTDYRSYEEADLRFSEGLNVIEGPNGEGKTNLAEAIYYLSLARSWRTSDQRALIHYGSDSASIRAVVKEGGLTREIEAVISKDGRRVFLNGKLVRRLSELSKLVNVVLFCPEDVMVFKGAPSERRRFLNVSLSKHSPEYFNALSRFGKVLEERNAALKAENVDMAYLGIVTDELIAAEKPLLKARRDYVRKLSEAIGPLATRLYGEDAGLSIVYEPFLDPEEGYAEKAKALYEKALEGDLYRKTTSVGAHREDFKALLRGRDIGLYGSQGENRLAAIALKLSPYFLIEEEAKKPIAVLDDVYSELDGEHASRLTGILKELGQTFVTATKFETGGASYIEVSDHKAMRR
jgi:DNA replication and repair protein RecF